ncbi:MAG: pesticidal protein Cry26Aa [Actinotalea sp.]|nr:pesticidal protein Cry26Aa [Actinotalea sp.]
MAVPVIIDVALVVLALTLLPAAWRVATGPTEADRAIGADHAFFVFVAVVALLAVRIQRFEMLDVVVIGTLVGFLSAVFLARYISRSRR